MYRRYLETSNPTNKGVKEPHIRGETEAFGPSNADVQTSTRGYDTSLQNTSSYLRPQGGGLLILAEETRTRGHSLQLAKRSTRLDIRKCFFSERVGSPWNSLTDEVVMSPIVFESLNQDSTDCGSINHSGSTRMRSSKIKRKRWNLKMIEGDD